MWPTPASCNRNGCCSIGALSRRWKAGSDRQAPADELLARHALGGELWDKACPLLLPRWRARHGALGLSRSHRGLSTGAARTRPVAGGAGAARASCRPAPVLAHRLVSRWRSGAQHGDAGRGAGYCRGFGRRLPARLDRLLFEHPPFHGGRHGRRPGQRPARASV